MSTPPLPTELRAPRDGRVLEIDWDDGSTTRYQHADLRAFCPCAGCQGHQGPIRRTKSSFEDAELTLSELGEVGNYGVRLSWEDGHATGIYAFEFLREMAGLYEASDEVKDQAHFER